jgi:hypothetical protein
VIRCGERAVYRAALQAPGFSGKIKTAFVERLNLTLRELIAPLSRRTWSIADDIPTLWRHVGMGRVYTHFCRPHESLTHRSRRGRFRYALIPVWRIIPSFVMPVPARGGISNQ